MAAMRTPLLLAAIAPIAIALTACSANQRRAIGGPVQAAAEKGVVLGTTGPDEPAPAAAARDKAAQPNLPATLGGDAEHPAYGPR